MHNPILQIRSSLDEAVLIGLCSYHVAKEVCVDKYSFDLFDVTPSASGLLPISTFSDIEVFKACLY